MKIREFTRPAITVNEDACYICEKFGFVLDGATGLTKENITTYPSDAQWFSATFKEYLKEALKDESKSLAEIVKHGITVIDKKYYTFDGSKTVKSKPSSALAVFRINGEYLEYMVLGDCSILLRGEKSIATITTSDLAKLDQRNINYMVQKAKENNINVIDARQLINNELIEVRNMQNKENGYWILSDNPAAADHALCGKVKKAGVKQVVVLSDGFSQIYDLFEIFTPMQLSERLISGENIEALYDILYKNQEKDKYCNDYPRFKLRDDATLIEMQMEQ